MTIISPMYLTFNQTVMDQWPFHCVRESLRQFLWSMQLTEYNPMTTHPLQNCAPFSLTPLVQCSLAFHIMFYKKINNLTLFNFNYLLKIRYFINKLTLKMFTTNLFLLPFSLPIIVHSCSQPKVSDFHLHFIVDEEIS